MARFLSDEWFDQIVAALARLDPDPEWPPLHLGQEISGAPGGTVRYTIHVARGRAHLERGSTDSAQATLVEDHDTAEAIASGMSVSELLSHGRIKLRGDPDALVSAEAALAAVAAILFDSG